MASGAVVEISPNMKLGLFGGSFDPVTIGHLLVAQAAREELGLDKIFFILAAQSPFKPENKPAAANERFKLLRLALAGKPDFEIDDQEIRRGGISYTIDTVRDYRCRFPDAQLSYLIGADHVASLPKWREADALAKNINFIVIPRPGQIVSEVPPGFTVNFLRGFPFGVSSSQVRDRVRAGLTIENLVKPEVAEAIRNNRLYLSPT
jgi:nicotinate-nucleotide adenylyltransferase